MITVYRDYGNGLLQRLTIKEARYGCQVDRDEKGQMKLDKSGKPARVEDKETLILLTVEQGAMALCKQDLPDLYEQIINGFQDKNLKIQGALNVT